MNTREKQLRYIAGKNAIGEKATLAMPTPLDLCSTEDHGYHLQTGRRFLLIYSLYPMANLVNLQHDGRRGDL
jgi:hypothetical protein